MNTAETDALALQLRDLFAAQHLAVLATDRRGQPYTSLVAFVVTDDVGEVLFATDRGTRKFENLTANPRVSLLIDSRTNGVADFQDAVAVTVCGEARELTGAARVSAEAAYLARHPHLAGFVSGADCALFAVRIESYSLVSRFEHVVNSR